MTAAGLVFDWFFS